MQPLRFFAIALLFALAAPPAPAQEAVAKGALSKMPVREITVFKDGNAFVLHEGRMPVNAATGEVVLDTVPSPVLGTFWPYSREKNAPLVSTVAARRRVRVERTALTLRDLLKANTGASVRITESSPVNSTTYDAVIAGVPERSADELEAMGLPPDTNGTETGQRAGLSLVLLKTDAGVRAVTIERILDVTFKAGNQTKVASEDLRSQLLLKFAWPGGKAAASADVGLVYLQRGVRWIPGYKITLDGNGKARVQLQATLLNELTDLENVTVHLVIGVPTFAFKDTPDPIGLQDTLARLSPYFDPNSSFGGQAGGGFSNAIMTQQARMGERAGGQAGAPNLGPEVAGGEKNEDLFVFTVRGVSLKKGARMVLPVGEYALTYRDVYTLDLPLGPPRELTQNTNTEQQAELARLMAAPKVLHKIRLRNTSAQPFTTAPALILNGDRILAQGLMTYAAPGADADLLVTTAVDIRAKKTEKEASRTPNAIRMGGDDYARVDLTGTVSITNFGKGAAALEITRTVGGLVDSTDSGGVAEMINPVENPELFTNGYFGRYGWPAPWWNQVNGVGRITWKLTLPAGKSADLNYAWHYFWR